MTRSPLPNFCVVLEGADESCFADIAIFSEAKRPGLLDDMLGVGELPYR